MHIGIHGTIVYLPTWKLKTQQFKPIACSRVSHFLIYIYIYISMFSFQWFGETANQLQPPGPTTTTTTTKTHKLSNQKSIGEPVTVHNARESLLVYTPNASRETCSPLNVGVTERFRETRGMYGWSVFCFSNGKVFQTEEGNVDEKIVVKILEH